MLLILRKILKYLYYRYLSTPPRWEKEIRKGSNVHIIDSEIDNCFPFLITIGDNVTITGATILAHDASTKMVLGYTKVGRVAIGSNVFIGKGSIILCNTRIGNKVIIGAGAVVAKDIPDNSVVIGNPCRIICTYDEYMERQRAAFAQTPVFNVPYSCKTADDRAREFEALDSFTGGFDI